VPAGVTVLTASQSDVCLPRPTLGACDAPYFTLPSRDFQSFAPKTTDASTLAEELTARAEHAGLAEVTISFERASGHLVPVVEAETGSPATFIREYGTGVTAVFGDTNRYEGVFLEILARSGRPVEATGFASRIGSGESWTNPSYARRCSCNGA
jgi:hypothetical protein